MVTFSHGVSIETSECQTSNLTRQNYKIPCLLKVAVFKFAEAKVQVAESGHCKFANAKVKNVPVEDCHFHPSDYFCT